MTAGDEEEFQASTPPRGVLDVLEVPGMPPTRSTPPAPPAPEPTHRLQGISTDRQTGLPVLLVVGPRRRLIEVPLAEADLLDLAGEAIAQLRRLGRG